MDPEDKQLLERTLELSRENNSILRRMQRTARIGMVWGFVKFLVIVIPLTIGFLYLQPYFGSIQEALDSLRGLTSGF